MTDAGSGSSIEGIATDILSQPLVLNGRLFEPCKTTTIEQDVYAVDLVQQSGLESLAGEVVSEATIGTIGQGIILAAYRSGVLFKLLATMLVEPGKKWTPAYAEANAIVFAGLEEAKEKETLRSAMVAVMFGFFVSGGLLSKTSPKSSVTLEARSEEESQPAQDTLEQTDSLGYGMRSSESLPDSIQTSTTES